MELQADCFAGIWGHYANQTGRAATGGVELDPDDIDEALNAAAAIGDDRIQRQSTGRVSPESFTHGSSQQRVEWFRRGFDSGDPKSCETFQARYSRGVYTTGHGGRGLGRAVGSPERGARQGHRAGALCR